MPFSTHRFDKAWKAFTPLQKTSGSVVCVELMSRTTAAEGRSGKVLTVTEMRAAKVLGPPPFRAQKRSELVWEFATRSLPEAVITSKERAWSAAGVKRRCC
jgi:hypothetical protein